VLGCVLWNTCTGLARIAPMAQAAVLVHTGETHLRQHHDGDGDGVEGVTSVGVSDVRTHSFLNPHSLHVAVGLYPQACDSELFSHAGTISQPVHGPSLQRICLQAALEKLTTSCCRLIFCSCKCNHAPLDRLFSMNFERGHEWTS